MRRQISALLQTLRSLRDKRRAVMPQRHRAHRVMSQASDSPKSVSSEDGRLRRLQRRLALGEAKAAQSSVSISHHN